MIRYHPIESCAPWTNADTADLRLFDWRNSKAEFNYDGDEHILTVSFLGAPVIVRMLDEFPLSTESEPEDRIGLIPHHFAYRVEGDPFLDAQSEAWRSIEGTPNHYQFITGAGCLDVITSAVPQFAIVKI